MFFLCIYHLIDFLRNFNCVWNPYLNLKIFFRRSHPDVYCKKDVPKNFARLTGNHLYWSLFFNKVATLLKIRLQQRCFTVNFAKFLWTPFSIEHLRWLLLVFFFFNFITKTNWFFCEKFAKNFCSLCKGATDTIQILFFSIYLLWPFQKNYDSALESPFSLFLLQVISCQRNWDTCYLVWMMKLQQMKIWETCSSKPNSM